MAQIQNDPKRDGAVLVRIVGMCICDNRLVAVEDCATSGTGGE